mgnify:CR=1 FL=1
MEVRQLMTGDVATISPDASLKEAARVMIERRVSGLPVIDGDNRLVGIVTEGDVLHQESLRQPATTLRSLFTSQEGPAVTVAEAMTDKVKSVSPEADHTEAARIMESAHVKRLPVVDGDDRLLGILSRADVLRVFARSDEEIAAEIRSGVIERVLWLNSSALAVEVADGKVSLSGTVPTKSDSRILEEMARRIDGVVEVDSGDISYEVDDTKRVDGPLFGSAPHGNL